MSEILLETNKGIIFEKVMTKNRCRVTVKNKSDGFVHMIYRFTKIDEAISSPYISWENLNCCGGWSFDSSYLLSAVQQGRKLCSGITFNTEQDLEVYRNSLADDCMYFCKQPMSNGPYTFYYIDVVRNGAISDFINKDDVLLVYEKLGMKNRFNKELVLDLLDTPMYYFISGETFDYMNPIRPEELIITGLLLGYPLESTAWLLEDWNLPVTKYKDI